MARLLIAVVLASSLAAACASFPDTEAGETPVADEPTTTATARERPRKAKDRRAVVAAVVDGDTIELRNGQRVRLVQIDAPEGGQGECYAARAAAALEALVPPGTNVTLERDPRLDAVDDYGRLLRYVRRGRVNVNVALVRVGAASVWFYDGDRGRYATRLLRAAQRARAARRGLWGACPGTPLDPDDGVAAAAASPAGGGRCAAGYRPCLPVRADLECGEIPAAKKPIRVTGADPYRLDADGDGYGCEGA